MSMEIGYRESCRRDMIHIRQTFYGVYVYVLRTFGL
jgi:hypothetical protein